MRTSEELLDQEKLMGRQSRDDDSDTEASPLQQQRRSRLWPRFDANIPGLLLVLIANLVMWLLVFQLARRIDGGTAAADDETSFEYYSPIHKHLRLPFRTRQVDAQLFPNVTDPVGVFGAPPGPEVDRAWARASRNMIVGLTRDEVLRLGKDPATAVQFSPEWPEAKKAKEDMYVGVVDVFHQIHCLDMLRQNLVFNYDYYWGDIYGLRPPAFRETHLRHCTSQLLQSIMCRADLAVVTHVWSRDTPVPMPDFAVNHQCRDFDALLRWRDTTDVKDSGNKFRFYTTPPPGAIVFDGDPGMDDLNAQADEFRDGEYLKDLHLGVCNA